MSSTATYDVSASRLTDEQLMIWMQTTLDGDLRQIPGVGEKTVEGLNAAGIQTSYQLLGKYLSLREPEVDQQEHLSRFLTFLVDAGCAKGYVQSQVQAISERMNVGFQLPVEVSDELSVKSASQMSETKMEKFLNKDLNGSLREDLHGVGPKSIEKMASHDVHNTWQLVGKFLMTLGNKEDADSDEPANSADEFEKFLKEVGTAASYRAAVVVQIVEKVGCGVWLPGDRDHPDGFQINMEELEIS